MPKERRVITFCDNLRRTLAGNSPIPLILSALALAACGADADYKRAARLQAHGEPLKAVAAWDRFIQENPQDPRVPEAAFHAGVLYADVLGRCPEAQSRFESAARSSGPFAEPAKLGLMSCPDYFPLPPGASWTYVDSLSGGENMRLETSLVVSTPGVAGVISGQFYAGETAFRDYRRRYEKEDWSVWEMEGGLKSPILRWPYNVGRSWTVERPQGALTYTIVADDAKVSVKAGSYSGCLKVKAQLEGLESWTFDYYCPGVGRVKNSVGVPGAENPNTELAKFATSP